MSKSRKAFTGSFKAQVSIEALKEPETLPELAKRFDLHPQIITKWEKEFLEQFSEIFETRPPEENFEAEKERMFAKKRSA